MKTLCVGIISRKILRGARVIASGRNVEWVNQTILNGEADIYEFAELDEEDHKKMIKIVDPDEQERRRILEEMKKVADKSNTFMLKTPLLTYNVIQLIMEHMF